MNKIVVVLIINIIYIIILISKFINLNFYFKDTIYIDNKLIKKKYTTCLFFSSAGFNIVYYSGILKLKKKHKNIFKNYCFSGISSGSIIAACLCCNISIKKFMVIINELINNYNKSFFKTNLINLLEKSLHYTYPNNAHIKCNNRLIINYTKISTKYPFLEPKSISYFNNKKELIDYILASCSIPLIEDVYPLKRQINNEFMIDGRFTSQYIKIQDISNISVDWNNKRKDKSDICPSIQLIKRLTNPPNNTELKYLYKLGKKDFKKYFLHS